MRKILSIALVVASVLVASSCSSYSQLSCTNEAGAWEKLLYDDETFLYYQIHNANQSEDEYEEGLGESYGIYHNNLEEAIEENGGIEGFRNYQKRELEELGYTCEISRAKSSLESDYKNFE